MDPDLLRIIDMLPIEDRGEIDFILNSPDFTDEEKNLVIADKITSITSNNLEESQENV